MSKEAVEIAARITALEQRLLVAVLQGDDHARSLARAEITRLKQRRFPPEASQEGAGLSTRTATASATAAAH